MKNNNAIRSLLGITQEDLALLLKVTRSQLAMFETGKRDLPVAAKLQLAEMLQYVQETKTKGVQNLSLLKKQEEQKKKVVAKFVLINQHKQLILEKKMKSLVKKNEVRMAKISLTGFLEQQLLKKDASENQLLKSIGAKAQLELENKGWALLIQHQIKKEVLQAEVKLLENYLQNPQ